jgi:hypothetical protein
VVNGATTSIAALIANDGGDGISLREAVLAANADNTDAADVIDFGSLKGTIQLTNVDHAGEIVISSNLAINGPGADLLGIQAFAGTATAGDGARIFNVDDGVASMVLDAAISGLKLTGGDANGSGGAISARENLIVAESHITANATRMEGGGIFAAPISLSSTFVNSLSIINCLITGNAAMSEGGGIRKQTGSLIIEGSTLSANTAVYGAGLSVADHVTTFQVRDSIFENNVATGIGFGGGAILAYDVENVSIAACLINENRGAFLGGGVYLQGLNQTATASITGSTISDNSATSGGGGISITNVQVTVASTTITRNVVTGGTGGGGGIRSIGAATATLSVIDSEVSANSTQRDGGGISGANVTVIGSTISGNSASRNGGGIHASGTLLVSHTTVTGNMAATDGGGISANGGAMLNHAIVAGNFRGASVASDIALNATLSYSLLGVDTGALITDQGGNVIGTAMEPINPLLSPLADNGGPTMTHAFLAGSPAMDAGDLAAMAGVGEVPEFDQRGFAFSRVVNGRIDMGAFEHGAVSADFDVDLDVDGFDFLAWQRGFGLTGAAATSASGNADGDLDVDGDDLAIWESQFGDAPGMGPLITAEDIALVSPSARAATADVVLGSFDPAALFAPPDDLPRAKRRLWRRG